MKKSDLVLIIVVVLLLVIAFLTTIGKGIQKVTLVGTAGMSEITYGEYSDLIEEEKPFLVVVEREGCSYCEKYLPVVEKVATDKNIPIYFIDIANLSADEQTELSSSNNYLKNKEWGTPTTLLLEGTKDLASISGYVEEKELDYFIEKYIDLSNDEEGTSK